MILADQHVHSDNSPDGSNSVIEICESALKKRFTYVAFTDHCEIDCFYKDRYNIGYKQSYFEAKKASIIFENSLHVNVGVEIGQATQNEDIADAVLKLPYDIVIASTHALPGMEDFFFLDYKKSDPKALFAEYLKEELKLVKWGKFNALAHLTYPLRYINGEAKCGLKTEDFGEEIEKILKELIKRELSLEINTSGLRQKYNTLLPDEFCLNLYKSLGGELITFGSDSHSAKDLGDGIAKGIETARKIGFKYYCIYNRKKTKRISL